MKKREKTKKNNNFIKNNFFIIIAAIVFIIIIFIFSSFFKKTSIEENNGNGLNKFSFKDFLKDFFVKKIETTSEQVYRAPAEDSNCIVGYAIYGAVCESWKAVLDPLSVDSYGEYGYKYDKTKYECKTCLQCTKQILPYPPTAEPPQTKDLDIRDEGKILYQKVCDYVSPDRYDYDQCDKNCYNGEPFKGDNRCIKVNRYSEEIRCMKACTDPKDCKPCEGCNGQIKRCEGLRGPQYDDIIHTGYTGPGCNAEYFNGKSAPKGDKDVIPIPPGESDRPGYHCVMGTCIGKPRKQAGASCTISNDYYGGSDCGTCTKCTEEPSGSGKFICTEMIGIHGGFCEPPYSCKRIKLPGTVTEIVACTPD